MPRGFWDWGINPAGVVVETEVGNPELAPRLGSIVTFDRRGQVVLLDSFEHGYAAWTITADDLGSGAALYAGAHRHGDYSLRLTAGSDGVFQVRAGRSIPILQPGTIGAEVSIALEANGSTGIPHTQTFDIKISRFDGTYLTAFILRLNALTGQMQYHASDGSDVDIGDPITFYAEDDVFQTLKLVVNTEDFTYERAFINGVSLSIADILAHQTTNGARPHTLIELIYTGTTGVNRVANVDDVILTQNEP